jgi:hypothetical protein
MATKPAAPSAADLQKNIDDLNKKLSSTTSKLDIALNPNQETYIKQTGETALTDAVAPVFAELYNKEYSRVKNINMTLGGTASNPQEKAFFTFNATEEATRAADTVIDKANQQSLNYKAQQEKINNWIKSQQSTQTQQIFNNYLQSVLKKEQPSLVNNMIDSNNPLFNMATYQKTDPKNRSTSITYVTQNYGQYTYRLPVTQYAYKDEKAAKTMLDSLTTIYKDKFNADPKLQKTWLDSYTADLKKQIKSFESELAKLNKKKK